MKSCLLCLEISKDLVGGVQFESTKWKELNIQNIIKKYFWPMKALQAPGSWLCISCWQELFDFHKFYERIEKAHAELGLIKTEVETVEDSPNADIKPLIEKLTFDETHFESEISIKESLHSECFIPEEEDVLIKEEPLEEIITDEAVPHSQHKNQCYIEKNDVEDDTALWEINEDDANNIETCSDHNFYPDDDVLKKKEMLPNDKLSSSSGYSKRNSIKSTKSLEKNNVEDDAELLEINEDDLNNVESCSDYNFDRYNDIIEDEGKLPDDKLSSSSNHAYDKYLKDNFQIKCSLCQIQAETFYELCKHFKSVHKMNGFVFCCKKKYYRRSLLVDHVRQHVNPNYFKCTVCNRVMADRKCLIMHNKTHYVKKEKVHPCDICNKKFSMNMSLELHKMSHLSEEEKHVQCTECDKKFASKSSLSNHVRSVHLKKYINICDICGRSIRCKEVFERHMMQHEGKPLPTVSCDVCGLILANNRSLKQHKLMVHPEGGKKEFSCPVCSKISPNLKAHKKHIQYNHEWGKDHKCTMCAKAFKTAYSLTEHMAAHTGTVLYTCPWCPKTFNSNAYFHSHRKKSHPREWEEATRKKYSVNLPPNNIVPVNNTNDSFTSSDSYNIVVKTEK